MTNTASSFAEHAREWARRHPQVTSLRAAVCDMNGTFRGKRLPVASLGDIAEGVIRMPLTLANQDIWGRDIEGHPVLEAGDGDGICRPTGRGPVLVDWLGQPSGLVPLWFFDTNGAPSRYDPRHALDQVLDRFRVRGLTPVVGMEMEFHLTDGTAPWPRPPVSPLTGAPLMAEGVNSLNDLDSFDAFFDDLYAACALNQIPAEAASSEGSPGQFEIALHHEADAMRAADNALIFKRLVQGIARKHRFGATFMAKPYADQAGNGLHVHFSLLDAEGRNIFDDGGPRGTDVLTHAVAGCLNAMPASTLIFAPHQNSYRRLVPGGHAPSEADWAYENRFSALRIPGGSNKARRIEHRVAGADATPYLVLAAVLGAALDGIEAGVAPQPPETGGPALPFSWETAMTAFEETPQPGLLPTSLAEVYALSKRQEQARFHARMTEFEVQTYLEVV